MSVAANEIILDTAPATAKAEPAKLAVVPLVAERLTGGVVIVGGT